MDKRKNSVQAVDRAIMILHCFENQNELGITEISKQLSLHKSTVFGLVSTLESNGFLTQNPLTGKYRLGIELYRIGTYVMADLHTIAMPYLHRLVSQYQETVNLVVRDGDEVLYIEKIESPHSMRISTQIGKRMPMYCTAVGKSILATLSDKEIINFLERNELKSFTPNTLVDRENLFAELGHIRKNNGVARDNEELEFGLICIGAPIANQRKQTFAGVSISGPSTRMTEELCKQIEIGLREAVERINSLIN